MLRTLATLTLAVALIPAPASAQSSCVLPVAAYLTDSAGVPLTGDLAVELRFYDDGAPEALPVECRSTAATLEGGWLRVLVDACEPPEAGDCGVVPLQTVFAAADGVWVGIRVGDDPDELEPRQLVGAVPYSLRAGSAELAARAETAAHADAADTAAHADAADTAAHADAADTAAHADGADDAATLDGHSPSDFASADDLAAHLATGHGSTLGVPTDLAVGYGGCALIDGRPICWPFTDVFPAGATYDSIAVSDFAACGLSDAGDLECFSRARNPSPETSAVTEVPAGTYQSVSAGDSSACALTTDGVVRCWGPDSDLTRNVPLGAFDAIDLDGLMACAAPSTGGVTCWGHAIATSQIISSAPTESVYSEIAVGQRFACALVADTGAIDCWGEAGPPSLSGVGHTTLVSTSWGVCALTAEGAVRCRLQRNSRWSWDLSRVPTGTGYTQLAGGEGEPGTDQHGACALHGSGEVHCWTSSNSGGDAMNQVPFALRYR